MMTIILIASALLIAFIGLLRYDIHKHKHRDTAKNDLSDHASVQNDDPAQHNDTNKS